MKKHLRLIPALLICLSMLTGCSRSSAPESGSFADRNTGAMNSTEGCAAAEDAITTEKKETVVWHVSDIHYISPGLIEDRDAFESLMTDADGKLTQYIGEITDAFISEALEAKPDAVVISGDLSLNGAKESHEVMADKLAALPREGIKVFVIPGNHDLGPAAYRFTADGVEPVEGTSPLQFKEIYMDCGFSDTFSEDEDTLSYAACIGDDLMLLAVDVNSVQKGSVPAGTMKWIEAQLSRAEEEGRRVIAVSHQNLFIHNPLFGFGYQINNSSKLTALYEKYGVHLNLSGHLHIQHIACENGITEIDASSLAVSPNQYGILSIGDSARYCTQSVPVTVDGIEDFAEYSADFFDISNSKFSLAVTDEFTDEEKACMTGFARKMNRGLFSGRIDDPGEDTVNGMMELWGRVPGFSCRYLSSMLPGIGVDHTKADIALK